MRKVKKDIFSFTKASVGLGVGSAVVAGVGGSSAGLGAVSGMMPIVGTAMMGGHTLRLLKKNYKKRRY